MKSLLELRRTRVAVAAIAACALTGSLGAGMAAAASRPAVAVERSSETRSVADEHRPSVQTQGRKVG